MFVFVLMFIKLHSLPTILSESYFYNSNNNAAIGEMQNQCLSVKYNVAFGHERTNVNL